MHRGTLRSHTGNRAYTLVEVLVVVTVLGIAGAMVVPAFSQTGTLRVQGAVRMLVADLTMAQSDAIAFQKGRAVVLAPSATDSAYTIAEVNGSNIDLAVDGYEHRRLGGDRFGGCAITASSLSTENTLVFDELGGPVTGPSSDTPANTQWIELTGSGQRFRIVIEAYTGRVTVQAMPTSGPEPTEGGEVSGGEVSGG